MNARSSLSVQAADLAFVLIIVPGALAPAFAEKPQVKLLLNFRWRHEFLDFPELCNKYFIII